MSRILFLIFILVPIIEIGLFIKVGGLLGFWPTMALILITAFIGATLVRQQGLRTLMTLQSRLQQGEMPTQQIIEGVLLAIAGLLLLTPGFMTDICGILLLLPAPRARLATKLMSKMTLNSFSAHTYSTDSFEREPAQSEAGDTFEGEFERKDTQNNGENHRLN